jgi:hypothetical protein
MSRQERIGKLISEQRAFINDCGGDLTGYLERYGDKNYPVPIGNGIQSGHYGEGARAIYKADQDELHRLHMLRF